MHRLPCSSIFQINERKLPLNMVYYICCYGIIAIAKVLWSILKMITFSINKKVTYPNRFLIFFFLYTVGPHFQLLNYIVWLRITDEGSLPELRIWFILIISSDLKWCIYLSTSILTGSLETICCLFVTYWILIAC